MTITVKPLPLLKPYVEQDSAAELHKHTCEYWRISSILRGRHQENLTISDAIKQTNQLLSSLGPHRALQAKCEFLSDQIVSGRRVRKIKNPPDNVRELHGTKKAKEG